MVAPPDFTGTVPRSPESALSMPGLPDVVFTQDQDGSYLSFYWRAIASSQLTLDEIVGHGETAPVQPVDLSAYREQCQRVMTARSPEPFRAEYVLRVPSAEKRLLLQGLISPLLDLQGQAIGVFVSAQAIALAADPMLPELPAPHQMAAELAGAEPLSSEQGLQHRSDQYHRLLTQIAWSIRRTLELQTIRQQTVDGIGATLGASRCLIFSIDAEQTLATIEAEYHQDSGGSMLGRTVSLAADTTLQRAIDNFRPCPIEQPLPIAHPLEQNCVVDDGCVVMDQVTLQGHEQSRLVVATGYQDQPNGLIVLYQCDPGRCWSEAEVNFLEELADQVGTAIAHASLFHELQRVNISLVRQQEALEDARARAEEASRLKSEFLANTSHELRTPLNGMMGFLKLILDGMADDPEEQQEFLQEALKSAEHLLDIINDVLDLAKIEAGRLQIELSPVNLNEVLAQLERSQSTSALQKGLTFEIQPPNTHDDVMVYANYQRLYQVLINLVGNAIKFTHEGGVTISTEFVRKKVVVRNQDCPGMVMLRVADTGIGVSLEKQDRLFQSFSQVDGSLTRRYGGTGLGLAISQTLVHEMGGEVNFYSMGEGLGSTVTFTVPLFQEPVAIAS